MKIVIATGATGGHIFPAIKVAEELKALGHEVITHGLSTAKAKSLKVNETYFKKVKPKGFSSSGFKEFIVTVFLMCGSVWEALKDLKKIKPDVVAGFGSYSAFPIVLAAVLLRIPTSIHEQNVVPGKANLLLSKFVSKLNISFKKSKNYFSGKNVVLTGCPCNKISSDLKKVDVLKEFGLKEDKKTLLVFGGSQGSSKINEIFISSIQILKSQLDFQVIHVSGKKDFLKLKQQYSQLGIPFALFDFLSEITKAYLVSDLAICRAGALTVSEIAACGLPAIFVPYPYAGGHQLQNAEVLCDLNAAGLIEEKDLDAEKLAAEIMNRINIAIDDEIISRVRNEVHICKATELLAKEITGLAKC